MQVSTVKERTETLLKPDVQLELHAHVFALSLA